MEPQVQKKFRGQDCIPHKEFSYLPSYTALSVHAFPQPKGFTSHAALLCREINAQGLAA